MLHGSRRGRHQAEYDFLMGGRRVEVKSSRMVFSLLMSSWLTRTAAHLPLMISIWPL